MIYSVVLQAMTMRFTLIRHIRAPWEGRRGMQGDAGGFPRKPGLPGPGPGPGTIWGYLGPVARCGPGPAQGPAIRLIDETLHRPDPPGKGPNFSAS